jgi:hypothetical protein
LWHQPLLRRRAEIGPSFAIVDERAKADVSVESRADRLSGNVDCLHLKSSKINCLTSFDPRKKEIDLSNLLAFSVSENLEDTNLRHCDAGDTLAECDLGRIAKHDAALQESNRTDHGCNPSVREGTGFMQKIMRGHPDLFVESAYGERDAKVRTAQTNRR